MRDTPPAGKLRVMQDLDSEEVFVAEWYPTLDHGWQLKIWDDGFVNEEHARDYIRSVLDD